MPHEPRALSAHAVLFDLDGVLVDSRAVVVRVWKRWMANHGLPITDLEHRVHGRRTTEIISEIAPQLNVDHEVAWLAQQELVDRTGLVALPGARTLYDSIPPDRRAVVTSGGRALATMRLEVAGFAVPRLLVSAEDVRHGKPDPEGYRTAAAALGVDPTNCIVVEDSAPGVAAGRSAGAQVIGVTTTTDRARLAAATVVVDSLARVLVVFDGHSLTLAVAAA